MARVDFERGEFGQLFEHSRRVGRSGPNLETEITDLYSFLQDARSGRQAEEAMQVANNLMEGHGVEAIRIEGAHVDNYHFDIVATYVNMGDTYNLTLVHDSENNSFHLTTYGDWIEQNERRFIPEHVYDLLPCSSCGEMTNDFDADTEKCPECRQKDEAKTGEQFDVWIAHRKLDADGNRHKVRAYWYDHLGTPRLIVPHLPLSVYARVYSSMQRLMNAELTLYADSGWLDSGYRLDEKSLADVLVQLDRFLES